MVEVDTGRFTVGVFQDAAWARKGIEALKAAGIAVDWLSIMAKDSPENGALMQETFGLPGEVVDIAAAGPILANGPLVAVLQGASRDLTTLGIAGTMRRVG